MTKIEKQKHEKELSERLVTRLKTGITLEEALEGLSVQELIAVWERAIQESRNKEITHSAAHNLKRGIKIIERLVPDRLSTLKEIYIAFNICNRMPYYLRNGYICLFSERIYASSFVNKCGESGRLIKANKIEGYQIKALYKQLFLYYGAKGAAIDPGQNCLAFSPEDFIENKEKPIAEPNLVRAMAMLQQESEYEKEYSGKKELIQYLRAETIKELKTSKFYVPVKKVKGDTKYPGIVKPGTKSPVALPIFTDDEQYNFYYGDTGFKKTIFSVRELANLSTPLFAVNPGSLWFAVTKEEIKKITKILA